VLLNFGVFMESYTWQKKVVGVFGAFSLRQFNTYEIDTESVTYLDQNYQIKDKIISKDFLKYNINEILKENNSRYREFSIQYFDTNCI
jgi:hypothetical protein